VIGFEPSRQRQEPLVPYQAPEEVRIWQEL